MIPLKEMIDRPVPFGVWDVVVRFGTLAYRITAKAAETIFAKPMKPNT